MKIRIVSGWKTLVCIAALCCGGLGNVMAQDAAPVTEVEITATVTEATPAASAGTVTAAEIAPEPAAAPVPTADKGDTAWLLVCSALVIFMTLPGLALFYGGLVRSKNVLSILMQTLVVFSLVAVLWALYGYSLAFTEGNAFIGGFDRLWAQGINGTLAATFTSSAVG